MTETVEILILLGVLTALGLPIIFSGKSSKEQIVEGDELHRLLYLKDVAYISLKDLEFEYQTGKIDDNDYRSLKVQYEAEAVNLLKKIDKMEKSKATAKDSGKNSFCTSCGTKTSSADKFCSSCGHLL